jgi:hypothetical protein
VPISHTVVDKYEVATGVFNADVCDMALGKQFSLVISVSTLEHVGWDETPQVQPKVLKAWSVMRDHLLPGGRMFVTVPMGYNHYLDVCLRVGWPAETSRRALRRVDALNHWEEVPWGAVAEASYGAPYSWGNVVVVLDHRAAV